MDGIWIILAVVIVWVAVSKMVPGMG